MEHTISYFSFNSKVTAPTSFNAAYSNLELYAELGEFFAFVIAYLVISGSKLELKVKKMSEGFFFFFF